MKDLTHFTCKTTVVSVDEFGTPSEIHCGKTWILGKDKCEAYLSKKPRILAAFAEWLEERQAAIEKWFDESVHFLFESDVGSLAARIDGVEIKVANGCGDGSHKLFFANSHLAIPPCFHDTGLWLDGKHVIEPMSYDLGGKPIFRIEADGYVGFYRCGNGDMAIVVSSRKDATP